jgi:hypothetical protein
MVQPPAKQPAAQKSNRSAEGVTDMSMQSEQSSPALSTPLADDLEVVACMQEILTRTKLPELKQRWSNRTIVLAFTTHASAGIRAMLQAGEYTTVEAESICRDFINRVMGAAGDRAEGAL